MRAIMAMHNFWCGPVSSTNVFVLDWMTDIMRNGNFERVFQLIPAEDGRSEMLIISLKPGFCG